MIKTKSEPSLLPALERAILKYRSLEMVLYLFHAENLRTFIVELLNHIDGGLLCFSPNKAP